MNRIIFAQEEQLSNPQCISNIIMCSLDEIKRRHDMLSYYKGKNIEIMKKQTKDSSFITTNNRVRCAFASMISNTITGYFKGTPITYDTDNERLLEVLQKNDVDELDYNIALDCSIYGVGFEMIYYNNEPKMVRIDPRECIAVYSNDIDGELIGVIRIRKEMDWTTSNEISFTDVYTKDKIYHYNGNANYMNLTLNNTENNSFKDVPFIVYKNNKEIYGDFEKSLDLINSYDNMLSSNIDSYEAQVHDNYLVLTGVNFADDEEEEKQQFFTDMINNGVILLKRGTDESGSESAAFISAKTDSSTVKMTLDKLEDLIFTLSQCVNLNDDKVGNASSGTAIQFKFSPMESLCDSKESLFKKGLYRRIELLSKYLGALGNKVTDIEITMTRDLPVNAQEQANTLKTYKELGVSEDTILANIPIVNDIDKENKESEEENNGGEQPTEQREQQ